MSFTENWMGGINDQRFLNDIIMPGSHDAGMSTKAMRDQKARTTGPYGGYYNVGRTQNLTVEQQCQAGIRFFDIRLADSFVYHGGKKVKIQGGPLMRAQHSPGSGTKEWQTVFGEEGEKIFRGVGTFLRNNPSEIVLIRLSKCMESVLERLPSMLGGLIGPDQLFKTDFRCNLLYTPIGEMRGKAIVMHDNGGDWSELVNQAEGIHPFLNVTKGGDSVKGMVDKGSVKGIASCGAYSNADSFQKVMGDLADYSSNFAKCKAKGKGPQATHWGLHVSGECGCGDEPHLFMLYWTYTNTVNPWNNVWTSTVTNDAGTEGVTAELEKVMAQFDRVSLQQRALEKHVQPGYSVDDYMVFEKIDESDPNYAQLRANIIRKYLNTQTAKTRCMPNVVMYDFANVQTSTEIINLNHRDILDECTRVTYEGGQKSQVFYSQGFSIPME